MNGRRIYLDHAATTPCRPEVVEAMLPVLSATYNASSIHREGRRARALVDDARERVGSLLGAKPREIVFTSSGTEANNLAILGVARALRHRGRHLVTVATEHHAVLHAFDALRRDGWDVTVLPVDAAGRLEPSTFENALRDDTVLASIMLANNEVGTIAPIANLASSARARGVLMHTDAVQAPGKIPVDVRQLGVDLLSLAAHKFYGPKGIGLLYVRDGTPLEPILHGGAQELGRRAGTEAVAEITGLARALELAVQERSQTARRLRKLQARLERGIVGAIEGTIIHAEHAERLPGLASFRLSGVGQEALLARLDLAGIAASSGSACSSGVPQPSHVVEALQAPLHPPGAILRLSLGRETTEREVDETISSLGRITAAMREFPDFVGTT